MAACSYLTCHQFEGREITVLYISIIYLVKFLTCTPTYIDGLLCQRVPRFLTPRQLHNNTFRHIARFFNLKTLLDVWERHIHISERRRLTAQKRTSQKFAFHIVAHRGKQNKKNEAYAI